MIGVGDTYGTHHAWRQRHGRDYETAPCPDQCLGALVIEDQIGDRLVLTCNGDGCTFGVTVPAATPHLPDPDSRVESRHEETPF